MPPALSKIAAYALPGFFASLAFFCLPDVPGGYRVVKWACAGLFLTGMTALLYKSIRCIRLPSSRSLLIALAAFPASLALSLFADGTDRAISLAGILRHCTGIAFWLLAGSLWRLLDRTRKDAIVLWLAIIAALAAIPLAASFFKMYSEGYFFEPDIAGTFGNPNWAAGFLITAVPVAVYALFDFPGRFKKIMAGGSLLLVLSGIAVSASKTGMLAGLVILCLSFSAFSTYAMNKKYILLAGLLLGLAGLVWYCDILLHWLQPRLCIWQALLLGLPDTWLFGNGALQALRTIQEGLAQVIGGSTMAYMPTTQVDFVHNDYLQALAEGGLAGLSAYLAISILTLRKAYASDSRRVHAAGLAYLALGILALADSPLQVPVTFYVWWFLMAVIWYDDPAREYVVPRTTAAIKAVILCFFALFFAEGGRQALGSYFWAQSGHSTNLVRQKEFLKHASFFLPEIGDVHTEYAQALERSRQHLQARAQALRAKAVKFDYDDLYVIAEADVHLGIKPPLAAWQDISDAFPCLQYPKIKLAEQYLHSGEYERAREECSAVINACQSVNPGKRYSEQAWRIMEMIDSQL